MYTLNSLLIVQETADTFGLVCLGFLFLSAQVFSRNFVLSIFSLYPASGQPITSKSSTGQSLNNVKSLSHTSTSTTHLQTLLTSSARSLRNKLRG